MKIADKWSHLSQDRRDYLTAHGVMINAIAEFIIGELRRGTPGVSTAFIVEYLRRIFSIDYEVKDWRLRALISNAYRFGAFKADGIRMRSPYGFAFTETRAKEEAERRKSLKKQADKILSQSKSNRGRTTRKAA